jgi:hypothetical protein
VLFGLEHAAHDEVRRRGDTYAVHPLDLRAGHRQSLLDAGNVKPRVAELAQPWHGYLHGSCSRKRKSFSKFSRRSGIPCLSIAMRSIPIPHANPCTFSGSYPGALSSVVGMNE